MSLLEGDPAQGQSTEQEAGATPEWIGRLPEELKTDDYIKTASKFKDEGSLLKSYVEAQKKISQKGVLLPSENATDEEKVEFYKAIGRPETAEGYEFKKPEALPEGVTWNDERTSHFAKLFYEIGVPKSQANAIFQAYNDLIFKEAEEAQAAVKEFQNKSVAELRKEWGSEFDRRIQRAQAAAKSFGGKEFVELMKVTGLDYHPSVIRMLEKVTARVGEHALIDGFTESGKPALTRTKLEEMMKDRRYCGEASERDDTYI